MAINDKLIRLNDDGSCGVTQLKGYPTVTGDTITPTLDNATGVINYEFSDLCEVFIERIPDSSTVKFFYCDKDGKGSIGITDLIGLITSHDSDGDGLSDLEEIVCHKTDPTNPDTDSDGLNDGDEVNTYTTDPLNPDTDNDGLNDGDEVNIHGTNPLNPDTDGGGVNDGDEVNIHGTNPLDPIDDPCNDTSNVVEVQNLGGNVIWKVSNNPATGTALPNLGDNIQYYDFSSCPQATIAVSNLGNNVTYQLLP